jgi:hypothetical protein
MSLTDAFNDSAAAAPPTEASPAVQALWWLRRGECVQAHEGQPDCDRVHAHLHRQEGDLANAGYWYRRAGRPVSDLPLAAEWAALTEELLAATPE